MSDLGMVLVTQPPIILQEFISRPPVVWEEFITLPPITMQAGVDGTAVLYTGYGEPNDSVIPGSKLGDTYLDLNTSLVYTLK